MRKRTLASLGLASTVAGLLAYLIFAASIRHLGPAAASPISVLWTMWGFAAAAVSGPLQHWMARQGQDGLASVRASVPRLAACAVVLGTVVGAGAFVVRGRLYHADPLAFVVLTVFMVVGAFVIGFARGLLAARSRFGALGLLLVSELVVRLAGVLVLVALNVANPVAFGIVLVAGSFLPLLWPPLLIVGARSGDAQVRVRALFATSAAQLLATIVLTGAPVALAVLGGAPARVTALFALLSLWRAPYLVTTGLVAPLTEHVQSANDPATVRRILRNLWLGTVVGVPAAAVASALGGSWVVSLIFGSGLDLPVPASALVAGGSALAVANLVAGVVAIGMGRESHATGAWVAGLVAAVIAVALVAERTIGVTSALCAAEVVAFLVLVWRLSGKIGSWTPSP